MSLSDQLKKLSNTELTELARIAILSDNLTVLKAVEKQNKKIISKESELGKDATTVFNVCRYGTPSTLDFIKSRGYDLSVKDPVTGNSC